MPHFVNPFTDVGFKIIFGQNASKPLLITLLNELLRGEHHIEDLTFIDKEDRSDSVEDKGIIYDLYCRTSTGEYIIVEMQNRWHSCFLDRTLFYMCRAIGRMAGTPPPADIKPTDEVSSRYEVCESAAEYGLRYKLRTIYGIFLMNFEEDDLDRKFRTDTVIADRETGRMINPHFRQIYLQFPYFTKELSECETLYDKLIYTLKNMNNWNRMPDALKEQVFNHLNSLAAVANLSEADRIAYDKALDRFSVSRIVEEDTLERGRKEGRLEEKYQNAVSLKKAGVPISTIAKALGLSADEIEKL
ncbi:MAG: PD-(D/E)XK nuclease family transposase [Bacteroides sp.]|nr:PD-(D/E)XK nuclease family transposase [Bacteroides sp.]